MSVVRVRCPATTANLGPGFDVLGLALARHNLFSFSPSATFELEAHGEGAERLPRDPREHLGVVAYQGARAALGLPPVPGLRVEVEVGIPPARGLGSSATATAAGLLAAEAHAGRALPLARRLELATELEGHPDNVVPCLLGGLVAAAARPGQPPVALRLPLPPGGPAWVVAIPRSLELSTREMRAALPAEVPFGDAVFNVGRVALLVGALLRGEAEALGVALEDRLHQPHRGRHIPGFAALGAAARAAGAHGLVISGSGPTLLAPSPPARAEAVRAALAETWAAAGIEARCEVLDLDEQGARLVPASPAA
ncbi:MAG: homoserine kinase [Planctomycetota bacterium]